MVKFTKNVRFYIRQRGARLKQLRDIKPFIASSSMVKIARVCGNPNCKCVKGEKHENYYLTYAIKKKTHTRYIPIDLEDEIREWVLEYKRIKKLIKEITFLQLKILKQYKVEKKARKKIGQPTDELLNILKQREAK